MTRRRVYISIAIAFLCAVIVWFFWEGGKEVTIFPAVPGITVKRFGDPVGFGHGIGTVGSSNYTLYYRGAAVWQSMESEVPILCLVKDGQPILACLRLGRDEPVFYAGEAGKQLSVKEASRLIDLDTAVPNIHAGDIRNRIKDILANDLLSDFDPIVLVWHALESGSVSEVGKGYCAALLARRPKLAESLRASFGFESVTPAATP